MNSGHYVSFVKGGNSLWYLCDDELVRQVGVKAVLDSPAYMLFYVRCVIPGRERIAIPNAALDGGMHVRSGQGGGVHGDAGEIVDCRSFHSLKNQFDKFE